MAYYIHMVGLYIKLLQVLWVSGTAYVPADLAKN